MDRGQCDKGGNSYSVGFGDRSWVLTGVPSAELFQRIETGTRRLLWPNVSAG
jgi:hypothetical protein